MSGGPRGTRRRIGKGGLHGGGGLWLAAAWHLAVPCPRSVRHRFWATAFSFVVCSGGGTRDLAQAAGLHFRAADPQPHQFGDSL